MPADNLAHIVAIRVGRIRIVNTIGNVAGILSKASVVGISNQIDAWQNSIAITREYVWHNEVGWAFPVSHVVENDVVSRVAEYEFVKQCG